MLESTFPLVATILVAWRVVESVVNFNQTFVFQFERQRCKALVSVFRVFRISYTRTLTTRRILRMRQYNTNHSLAISKVIFQQQQQQQQRFSSLCSDFPSHLFSRPLGVDSRPSRIPVRQLREVEASPLSIAVVASLLASCSLLVFPKSNVFIPLLLQI